MIKPNISMCIWTMNEISAGAASLWHGVSTAPLWCGVDKYI